MNPNEAITIITTICAIPSQPSTWIIDQVYASVRYYLPLARWLFLFDGVHAIQEDMRENYEKYAAILRWRINTGEWTNVEYIEFPKWGHQSSMIRFALRTERIQTPLVLWMEHDFVFNGLFIDWQGIVYSLLENEVAYIRFPMLEETRQSITALNYPMHSKYIPIMGHRNYSSLPNVCRLDFLQRVAELSENVKDHIECLKTEGIGYNEEQWRLALYTPSSGELPRFYTLDGRGGRTKPRED